MNLTFKFVASKLYHARLLKSMKTGTTSNILCIVLSTYLESEWKKTSVFVNIKILPIHNWQFKDFLMSNYNVEPSVTFIIYIMFNSASTYWEPSCAKDCADEFNSKCTNGFSNV